jgi:hypothetical protein
MPLNWQHPQPPNPARNFVVSTPVRLAVGDTGIQLLVSVEIEA